MDLYLETIVLSHPGVSEEARRNSFEQFSRQFNTLNLSLTEEKPDLLLFTTGGSEHLAIQHLRPDHFILLAANRQANAFASAMEVMAYARKNEVPARLICLDDEQDQKSFLEYTDLLLALKHLRNSTVGLIGESSPWLVASGISSELLSKRLSVQLKRISWDELKDYRKYQPGKDFLEKYGQNNAGGMEDASRINAVLAEAVEQYHLDAVAVECFPLVQQQHVTACLSLSDLNDRGIVAACEGDLPSMVGMMIGKAISGMVPWMANVAAINNNAVLLAHCTAPTNLLSGFTIDTHYETGEGTAIMGEFKGDEVTVFRLDNDLERIFLSCGHIIERPQNPWACRTQINVEMPGEAIFTLKSDPLGNHHLVLPGNQYDTLKKMSEILSLEEI